MEAVWGVIWALLPTICVGVLFWFVMRSILRADRHEREAQARIEAQELERDRAERRPAEPRG